MEQTHKLSHFFSDGLCDVIEGEIVADTASLLFPATTKAHNIAMKYKHCEKLQLQQRMQSFDQCHVGYFDAMTAEKEIERMKQNRLITSIVENPIGGCYLEINKQAFEPLPSTEYTFASAVVQRGLGVYDFKLEVIPTDKYTGIVPDRIVQSALAHRHNFDKLAIMEPKITELKPSKNFMDDPVLVGQLNGFPNHLFLIDARDDVVQVHSFSQQISLQTEKESLDSTILGMSGL